MTKRTLRVHGQATNNTFLKVTVDDTVVKEGLVVDELYSFTTSTEFHGKATIRITVVSGEVTITNVTSTYPAVFNNDVDGFLTFRQPILNPFVVNKKLVDINTIKLKTGDTFEYDHLMFNGPHFFVVHTHKDVHQGDIVKIGDFLTGQSKLGPNLYPIIGYDWFPFEMGNTADEERLFNFIYNNTPW